LITNPVCLHLIECIRLESFWLTVCVGIAVLCAPSGSVATVTSNSMVVLWSEPSCPNGILRGYFVCYEAVKNSTKMCFNESKNAANRTLSSLEPFTNYSISVFGYTSIGNGSAWTSFNTTTEWSKLTVLH